VKDSGGGARCQAFNRSGRRPLGRSLASPAAPSAPSSQYRAETPGHNGLGHLTDRKAD
jgi:hypothetical protein